MASVSVGIRNLLSSLLILKALKLIGFSLPSTLNLLASINVVAESPVLYSYTTTDPFLIIVYCSPFFSELMPETDFG